MQDKVNKNTFSKELLEGLIEAYETIKTQIGNLKVKVVEINGKKIYRPEYEECKKIADEKEISILEVYRIVDSLNSK